MSRFLVLAILAAGVIAPAALSSDSVFVEQGRPVLVQLEGAAWTERDGALVCGGVNNYLWAGMELGAGDFAVETELVITDLATSAASFVLGDSHFGLEGGKGVPFVQGPLFGGRTIHLSDAPKVTPGEPFTLTVARSVSSVRISIDGEPAVQWEIGMGPIGRFGLRPWRSTMHVIDFRAEGTMVAPEPRRTKPVRFSIPQIDLAFDKRRQTVVEHVQGQYLGHPTTILMADGQTIFTTYPLGHGGPAAVLKRSDDGGLTWTDRLPVPENWSTANNCPSLHRLIGPDGKERLVMMEGGRTDDRVMRQSISENGGGTWTPLEPNGLHCVVAPNTIVPISGGRLLAVYHNREGEDWTIRQSVSSDGGRTWEPERVALRYPSGRPCEPAIVKSPDGRKIAMLIRENSRKLNSLISISEDEGATWRPAVELPASLTGDRHMPRYAEDGRLVITFRDMAEGSPTKGDFVVWVGRFEDLIDGSEGEYRVRLLTTYGKPSDTGYAGLERLPDGSFVTVTYAPLAPGAPPSVMAVRFELGQLDRRAATLQPISTALFTSGQGGHEIYRIPALLTTSSGTVLAFCEGRVGGMSDSGDINMMVRRSTDSGQTWSGPQVVWDDGGNTCGNPCPVEDETTGTIWLLMTHNLGEDSEHEIIAGTSTGTRTVWVTRSQDDGLTWDQPKEITADTKLPEWTWYATGPGVGIQLRQAPYQDRLVIPCDDRGDDGYFSHAIYSDDGGNSWQLGGRTSDGTNECQVIERTDGSLLINMRTHGGTLRTDQRMVSVSEDGGGTWSPISEDETLVEPHCQASLIRYMPADTGDLRALFSNPATADGRREMTVRLSLDDGETWKSSKLVHPGPSAYSCLTVLPDGSIGLLFEKGDGNPYETITFTRFPMEYIRDGM